jgi:hypothetical protein
VMMQAEMETGEEGRGGQGEAETGGDAGVSEAKRGRSDVGEASG